MRRLRQKSPAISRRGSVYILTNETMPGIVKIGRTIRDVSTRVDEINSATGVAMPYMIAAIVEADDPTAVERATHTALARHRVNARREFFRVDIETAVRAASKAAKANGGRLRTRRRVSGGDLFVSSLVVTLAGVPVVMLFHHQLPHIWVIVCMIAGLTGKPAILSDLLGIMAGRGKVAHVAIAAAAILTAIISFEHPDAWYLAVVQRILG